MEKNGAGRRAAKRILVVVHKDEIEETYCLRECSSGQEGSPIGFHW